MDAFPSYNGRSTKVTYHLKATMDHDYWIDKNKMKDFNVENLSHQIRPMENNVVEGKTDYDYGSPHEDSETTSGKINNSIVDKDNNRNQNESNPHDFRKYNYNYHRYRKKYSKQDRRIQIELFNEGNTNISENSGKIDSHGWIKYFKGTEINGNVIVEKDLLTDKPSNVGVSLIGIEYAFAGIYNTISEVEEYELKVIPMAPDLPNSAEKTFTRIYQNNDKQEECNPVDNVVIPFSLRIPNVINKSYVARYSEYIWVLDFKINVPFSKDIHVREIIAIV